ncbi:uncharacterized protein Z519_02769 [Cladophialophora bantiana CBS 173.52]|uniref:Uncharacterized protein n=1 Tax=Cladophialophora bantiana (strain ATCC 10958 / CBS 173.52 / CDC B-1940 / NIH 8579) TaxID=1442370 RepID=A0A0D2GG85_CLAB1|nr:uncharacterized protein Z519_02769 [Cladophialophora bantiana CBS 173.52]KIW97377.1 hypothetical protein Z519_02769 [Cladophialophora bantiana CBS 173.52]
MAYSGPYLCSVEYSLYVKLTQPGRASISLNRGLNAVKKVTAHAFSDGPHFLDTAGSGPEPRRGANPSHDEHAFPPPAKLITSSFKLPLVPHTIHHSGPGADFSTYNIARSHSLDAQFEMQYGEKRSKFRLRKIPAPDPVPACYCAEEEDHHHNDLRPGGRRLNQIACTSDHDGGGDQDDVWIIPPPSEFDLNDDEIVANALIAEPLPQYP